jgi:hypothetical protein
MELNPSITIIAVVVVVVVVVTIATIDSPYSVYTIYYSNKCNSQGLCSELAIPLVSEIKWDVS